MSSFTLQSVRLPSISLLLILCALRPPVGASQASPLARDPSLTFPVLLQQSLLHSPEYVTLAARDAEAASHLAAARRWLAGRPTLEVTYADDQPRSATGMTELEYGLALPLWRPGERRGASLLARSMGRHAEAWRQSLELTVAGQLRDALAALEVAERGLEIERSATRDTAQLVSTVERLFEAGEAAALDVAQARTLLLTQRRQELEAESALAQAEAAYVRLTGLSARPANPHRETPTPDQAIGAHHPWLRMLSAGVDVADQQIQRARLEARGNPALAIGARRERGSRGEDYNDSMVLGLSVPFGGSAHVDAQVSSAKREKAESEAAVRAAQRELTQRLDETRRELATVTQSLRLTEEQVALDRQQWEMARAAFEAGESTLFHVLTALRQSRASAREHELLRLRSESLVPQLNQIVGVLP